MTTQPSLPDGLRIYAIGDIHGRYDLLTALAARIRADIAENRPRSSAEIHVGDYIDRGPQSREVVEWLIETPPLTDRRICLKGNHEAMLLAAMGDSESLRHWLFNGGGTTLNSYGLTAGALEKLPRKHLEFYRGLGLIAQIGPYLFVHAGIRPGLALADQDEEDLVWIREPFLSSNAEHGVIVVHGHTPVDAPDVQPNRINIDTGAVFSGNLTCVVLEGASRRFLSVAQGDAVAKKKGPARSRPLRWTGGWAGGCLVAGGPSASETRDHICQQPVSAAFHGPANQVSRDGSNVSCGRRPAEPLR